jgi:hypothetical protein
MKPELWSKEHFTSTANTISLIPKINMLIIILPDITKPITSTAIARRMIFTQNTL